jgi:putative transposase
MPRTARVVLPEVALHVTQRGVDGGPCFFRASDYRNYLRYLRLFALRFGCAVHAYCLMTNHVHLLITPPDGASCGRMMKFLGQCYVQTTNKALGRKGTLWQGRFFSCLVPSEAYVLACYRYIELNPVRAGMVSAAHDYPWSSHRANAGAENDVMVKPHPAMSAVRPVDYRAWFDEPLDPGVIEEIRRATRSGRIAGVPRRRGRPAAETGSVPISEKQGLSLFQRSE